MRETRQGRSSWSLLLRMQVLHDFTYIYIYVYICIWIFYIYIHTYIHIHVICTDIYIHNVYVHVYIYMCVYACMLDYLMYLILPESQGYSYEKSCRIYIVSSKAPKSEPSAEVLLTVLPWSQTLGCLV